MSKRLLVLLTGGLLLVLSSTAVAATVSVRIEGENGTLLPRTTVTTPPGEIFAGCPGESAAGAVDVATNQNWSRTTFPDTFVGERHDFSRSDYWALWPNYAYGQVGICDQPVADGDEVIVAVDFFGATPTRFPLRLTGVPATARPGDQVTVTVTESQTDGSATTVVPASGATVAGGDQPAVTGADGRAVVTLSTRGAGGLRATKASRVPSATEPVCVTDGADGLCGSAVPGAPGPAPGSAAPARGAGPDREAPQAFITGIREQQAFRRGRGPRELTGAVGIPSRSLRDGVERAGLRPDPSGLLTVKLRLTRRVGDRCTYFSGRSERFRPNRRGRCGAANGYWFAIGDAAEWRYLLPGRLPRGRYVLDVNAIDKAYNRDDERRRRQNRIVFHVR